MNQQRRASRRDLLQQILNKLCRIEGINAAFLASGEGLHIASVVPSLLVDQDELTGLVTRFRRLAFLLQERMMWAPVDEISVLFGFQHRLVARSVQIGNQELVLIILVTPQSDHRRIMTQALQVIQHAWHSRRGQGSR